MEVAVIKSFNRGDELMQAKFSNTLRCSRELADLIEFCLQKVIRIIFIHDKIDSRGECFLKPKLQCTEDVWFFARRVCSTTQDLCSCNTLETEYHSANQRKNANKSENKTIVAYDNGHFIDDILCISGFNNRCSVFRILNKYGVSPNHSKFSEPLGKRKAKKNNMIYSGLKEIS